MAVSTSHKGWRNEPANSRLSFYYEGTRVGDIKAKGIALSNSVDSAAVADEVTLGAYELSAGNRALAWSQEAAVVASVTETDYSHSVPVRINGTTYNIMMAATLS
jgi:hypothetical protein